MAHSQQPPDRAPVQARLRPPAHRAARRVIAQWTVEYLIVTLITLVQAGVVAAVVEWFDWSILPSVVVRHIRWLPAGVAVAGLVIVAVVPTWRYRVHRWEVGSDVVYTRTGWFSRHWQLVPVSRIQTVDTEQSWIERPLGLATMHIRTASHAGSSKVAGLPVDTATLLAADLAHRAHDLRDDAT
ncbi:MAG: rane-flanked domain protein [Actinomycetia bacterium]|nr:rane-flanked domain protein [Actinomycetes bacterium]